MIIGLKADSFVIKRSSNSEIMTGPDQDLSLKVILSCQSNWGKTDHDRFVAVGSVAMMY